MKKIYTIDKDGFITDNKDVGNNYIMNPDDFEGKPPFENGKHHVTGLERPKTDEEIALELETLIINNKKEAYEEYLELKEMKGSNSDEALAAKDAYNLIDADGMCNCRHDLETEIEILKADGIKLTEALLISEGVWS